MPTYRAPSNIDSGRFLAISQEKVASGFDIEFKEGFPTRLWQVRYAIIHRTDRKRCRSRRWDKKMSLHLLLLLHGSRYWGNERGVQPRSTTRLRGALPGAARPATADLNSLHFRFSQHTKYFQTYGYLIRNEPGEILVLGKNDPITIAPMRCCWLGFEVITLITKFRRRVWDFALSRSRGHGVGEVVEGIGRWTWARWWH